MNRIALFTLILLLTGCKGIGLSQLDTVSEEDRKREEWWDSFYGRKAPESQDCSFYGTCKKSEDGFWGNSGGGSGGGADSWGHSDSGSAHTDSGW